jgi:hypothetical protein
MIEAATAKAMPVQIRLGAWWPPGTSSSMRASMGEGLVISIY